MSWQAAVVAMLALTLLGGFAWYERSRPPSQIVALVAALAAISVAGRVAFSPIPNVVPSTDITLIAGYTLGGAPGFAVGALTGLVSNFWLGQGPWTPWQMAGWGLTGILGAVLAVATGRRMGRLSLAAVCALAGFAYGALLDFSVMFGFGGEQSLDRYLAISARGLPFNIAHAAGNAALALVAGPAMVRMLTRYRRRFEFAWKPARAEGSPPRGVATGAVCVLAALLIATPALVGGPRADASGGGSSGAVAWLRGSAERRWRLWVRPRGGVEPGDDRLGGARAGGRRGQSARCRSRRCDPDRLPGRDRGPDHHHRRHRAHDPAAARRGPRSPSFPGPRPGQPAARPPRRRRLLGSAGQPDRLRHPRAEGRRG